MSNWEDEDADPFGGRSLAAVDAWDGEDEDVKDAWDASSDSGEDDKQNEENTGVPKKKKTLQEKIKEREDRQRELNRLKAEAEKVLTEAEKRQMQEESDLIIAKDALGVDGDVPGTAGLVESFDPKSYQDFADFRFRLCTKLMDHKDSPHFFLFVEDLTRELASCLNSEDSRKLSTMLSTMSNEKLKRENAKKQKKKGKNQLKQVGNAIADYNGGVEEDFDVAGDEYDDFM